VILRTERRASFLSRQCQRGPSLLHGLAHFRQRLLLDPEELAVVGSTVTPSVETFSITTLCRFDLPPRFETVGHKLLSLWNQRNTVSRNQPHGVTGFELDSSGLQISSN
jgi:hypothetical protein